MKPIRASAVALALTAFSAAAYAEPQSPKNYYYLAPLETPQSSNVTMIHGHAVACGQEKHDVLAARILVVMEKKEEFGEALQKEHADKLRFTAERILRNIIKNTNWRSYGFTNIAARLNEGLDAAGEEVSNKTGIHTMALATHQDMVQIVKCTHMVDSKGPVSWDLLRALDVGVIHAPIIPIPPQPRPPELQANLTLN